MAEYLRFQLNTAPHVSLCALVGETGAYVIKARFQIKVRNSNSLVAFVESQVHRSYRFNSGDLTEMMENINYLFYLAANYEVDDLPDYSILTRPKPHVLPVESVAVLARGATLRQMPRSSAATIRRLRCKMFGVKSNLVDEGGDRKCVECGVTQDEKHVLDACPLYGDIRKRFHAEEDLLSFDAIYSEDAMHLIKMADFADDVEAAVGLVNR